MTSDQIEEVANRITEQIINSAGEDMFYSECTYSIEDWRKTIVMQLRKDLRLMTRMHVVEQIGC